MRKVSPDRAMSAASPELRRSFIAYVSGSLSISERDAFEQRLLEDEHFAQQITALEEDILEDYAAGALEPAEQAALRTWVMASARRREQVRLTRLMLLQSPRKPHASKEIWVWLAAAAACILAGAGIFAWRRAPSPVLAPSAPPVASVHAPSPAPAVAPQPDVILLIAERLRGTNTRNENRYVVHSKSSVHIQILIPNADAASRYTLVLRSEDRSDTPQPPVHVEGLLPHTASRESYVETTIPSGSLHSGTYLAQVSSKAGTFATLFRVSAQP